MRGSIDPGERAWRAGRRVGLALLALCLAGAAALALHAGPVAAIAVMVLAPNLVLAAMFVVERSLRLLDRHGAEQALSGSIAVGH